MAKIDAKRGLAWAARSGTSRQLVPVLDKHGAYYLPSDSSEEAMVKRAKSKLPKQATASIGQFENRLICGHAADVMKDMPEATIDLIVTSPPYWSAVEYDNGVGAHWPDYDAYLDDMMRVWRECARVLRPNGKLCLNTPIMPVPKTLIDQHTRHLKNIAFDLEDRILTETDLLRFSLFVWQKQTSKMMFGSYPYPGNIIENNTIEFINVYVKPGKPPKFSKEAKQANIMGRGEWLDLAQQVWFMYPEDVKRTKDHPAPFPQKLPARCMRLYTYGACQGFRGELVLDPFVGTGTTCAVAKSMGRRWIGIDVSANYLKLAEQKIRAALLHHPLTIVGRPKYPTREELRYTSRPEASSAGPVAVKKHKRKTYGRKVAPKASDQLPLV